MNLSLAKHHYQEAKAAQQKQDYQTAIIEYKKVLELLPDEASILANLANCYFAVKKYSAAKKYFSSYLNQIFDLDAAINLAICYEKENNYQNAIELYLEIIKTHPDNFISNYNLATCYLKSQQRTLALEHFKQALNINPVHESCKYHIAALTGTNQTKAPDSYVTDLFDAYAGNFDDHLKSLSYKTPSEIFALLKPELKPKQDILDLGCGTGLMGELLTTYANKLIGVDLSDMMLAKAKQKNIYSELNNSEIISYLQQSTKNFDLIVAADVLVYLGCLDGLFKLVKQNLKNGAQFAFSVETLEAEEYCLTATGRFKHSDVYIRKLITKFDFNLKKHSYIAGRQNQGKAVTAGLYVIVK